MSVLERLRTNPKKTIESSYLYFGRIIYNEGCKVRISEQSNGIATVFNVTKCDESNDYFFPYIPSKAGQVNVNNPKDGTIVITQPMNGCALEVRYDHCCYNFYHDYNGKSMSCEQKKGVLCCRIVADDYWDNDYIEKSKSLVPVVQFVCVYLNQKWHVGAFGLKLTSHGNDNYLVTKVFEPKGGHYRGCFSSIQYLMKE